MKKFSEFLVETFNDRQQEILIVLQKQLSELQDEQEIIKLKAKIEDIQNKLSKT